MITGLMLLEKSGGASGEYQPGRGNPINYFAEAGVE